ncbi:hypothetical protein BpHYR1_051149 [Brachionus plicatilis]|uniref:Uncharacterized protein n=1 Tax=Brachionus plicatilis TaxID=10195 RepID=A0A3M7SUU4_BRAPC|nr:hypothetical protein BpHYR1_051149 [Brachionus plicatilis]
MNRPIPEISQLIRNQSQKVKLECFFFIELANYRVVREEKKNEKLTQKQKKNKKIIFCYVCQIQIEEDKENSNKWLACENCECWLCYDCLPEKFKFNCYNEYKCNSC